MTVQSWMNGQSWQKELASLKKRDLTLWLLCGTLVLLLCIGLLVLLVPTLLAHRDAVTVDVKNLPQLSISLMCLVALFALQINRQRRELSLTRDALFRRLMQEERNSMGIMDPDTQTYSTVVLQSVLEKMTAEATEEAPLSIIELQIQSVAMIRRRNGDPAVEHLVRSLAEILRSSLRGSDRIFKSGETQFTVLLPNTPEDRSDIPVARIVAAVERWNSAMNSLNYKLKISLGKVTCTGGGQAGLEVLTHVREQRNCKTSVVWSAAGNA